jgi:acetyl esterase/lipase
MAVALVLAVGVPAGLMLAAGAPPKDATLAPGSEVIHLLPRGAPKDPDALPETTTTSNMGTITRNVSDPTLAVYPADPATATGVGMIVAPGGGFHMLSIDNEGVLTAQWLNRLGITAFVLRYRLLRTGDDFPAVMFLRLMDLKKLAEIVAPLKPLDTADGEAAVRYVRHNAARWKLSPHKIGMMGFSAGGAVTLWTMQANHADSRPDFAATIYPGLLPDPIAVPVKAPPLFVLVAEDDPLAGKDSPRLAKAWQDAGNDTTFVTYPKGGHGFGMKPTGKPTDAWTGRMQEWLGAKGLLTK